MKHHIFTQPLRRAHRFFTGRLLKFLRGLLHRFKMETYRMIALFRSRAQLAAEQTQPMNSIEHLRAENERLRRSELQARQIAAALMQRETIEREDAKAYRDLVLGVTLAMNELPAKDYSNESRHSLDEAAHRFVRQLKAAGVRCEGLEWYLDASTAYAVKLLTYVQESRVSNTTWLRKANQLTVVPKDTESETKGSEDDEEQPNEGTG